MWHEARLCARSKLYELSLSPAHWVPPTFPLLQQGLRKGPVTAALDVDVNKKWVTYQYKDEDKSVNMSGRPSQWVKNKTKHKKQSPKQHTHTLALDQG